MCLYVQMPLTSWHHVSKCLLQVTTPEPLPPDSPLLALRNCVIFPHIGRSLLMWQCDGCDGCDGCDRCVVMRHVCVYQTCNNKYNQWHATRCNDFVYTHALTWNRRHCMSYTQFFLHCIYFSFDTSSFVRFDRSFHIPLFRWYLSFYITPLFSYVSYGSLFTWVSCHMICLFPCGCLFKWYLLDSFGGNASSLSISHKSKRFQQDLGVISSNTWVWCLSFPPWVWCLFFPPLGHKDGHSCL